MLRKQKGFTLIELMILILIVAILAAIALPMYNDYTIRTKIAEGVTMAGVTKNAVSEYALAYSGNLPSSNSMVGLPDTITSPYVANVIVGAGGTITVSFTPASGVPSGKVLQYMPTVDANSGSILWSCNGPGTTIRNSLLPKECRS